ncbi:MAG: acyl carrier protein phosphodiesterase [Flavisolibacter sp.]
MNYLGHAYLSFNSPQILVGNMISDFVKGKEKFVFNGNIQKGMVLHRAIDEFTDTHPATKRAMEVFRPAYRLYSAPIMDILFDYFLANDANLFSDGSLKAFADNIYAQLEENTIHLPNRFLQVFTYMKADNWLYNYKYPEGIRRSLHGLVRRATYINDSDTAYRLFLQNQDVLNECYQLFFVDVKQYAKQRFQELIE